MDRRENMQSTLNPYISFEGNARAAMEFYHTVFGGELKLSTFAEMGGAPEGVDPSKIMHSVLHADNGITIMAADSATGMREFIAGTNMSLSLSGDNEEELTSYYNKLADGGQVQSPLKKESWGDTFGMCVDKFGTFWMVNITAEKV
jgi:PhnB protein